MDNVDDEYREKGIVLRMSDDVTVLENDVIDDGNPDRVGALGRHLCLGCQKPVCDRYVLHVRDHGYWHAECLKCSNCQDNLSTHKSCYVKNEQVFCRNDYNTLFGQSCVKCSLQFKKEQDWMRIAGQNRYHIACFLCKICKRQLGNNEKYHLVNGTDIYCTNHYRDMVSGDSSEEGQQPAKKAKRNRTSYTEAQIKFLQERFLHDSNPDGNELEKIANHINLKKRVVQVWFQNNRARLKKTANNTKGGNQDISGQANGKGRVATPGSLSDSALTMDWDNSLDPTTLEDQGYISPSASTTATPTHHPHPHPHHQHLHHHHHHHQQQQQQQQQISPTTPQHYQDLFNLSAAVGGGGVGSALTAHLHNPLTPGGHNSSDPNSIGSGDGVCGDQQMNPEFPEINPQSFTGNDDSTTNTTAMTFTTPTGNDGCATSITTATGNGNHHHDNDNENCVVDSHATEDNTNPLSSSSSSSLLAAATGTGPALGEDGGTLLTCFDPEKMNSLNSLRNSFASEKYLDSFRRLAASADPRERHEQQIRQMMQYQEQQQQQQQHYQHNHHHHHFQQHPFPSLYTPPPSGSGGSSGGGGGAGFGLSQYYSPYATPTLYPGNGILGNGCPSPTNTNINNTTSSNLSDQIVSPQNFLHPPPPHHQLQLQPQPPPPHHHLLQNTEKENHHHHNHISLQEYYNHHHHHQQQQQQQTPPSNFQIQMSPRDQKPSTFNTQNNNNNNNNSNNNDNSIDNKNNIINNNNEKQPQNSKLSQYKHQQQHIDDTTTITTDHPNNPTTNTTTILDNNDKLSTTSSSSSSSSSSSTTTSFYSSNNTTTNLNLCLQQQKPQPPHLSPSHSTSNSSPSRYSPGGIGTGNNNGSTTSGSGGSSRKPTQIPSPTTTASAPGMINDNSTTNCFTTTTTKIEEDCNNDYRTTLSCNGGSNSNGSGRNSLNSHHQLRHHHHQHLSPHHHQQHNQQHHHQHHLHHLQQQQHNNHHHQNPYQFVPISHQNGARLSGNGEIHYYGNGGRMGEMGVGVGVVGQQQQHHNNNNMMMDGEANNEES